ncbi:MULTISPECIES: DUF262 domain-containing protein [Acinetobacter]|uniref:DUF262 domain-containing protein n=1 Tax=Acinetobacter TaxID=469 RepID=UPI0002AED2C3|nr:MULTISPECIES: DUF262 domain-containing protein [Acinetobacter]ELW85322.1 PF03235 family protein [Acinetobacter sp. WC-743]
MVENNTNFEELIEKQLDEETKNDIIPDIKFDLSVNPSDPSLELLTMKLDSNELIIPFYQRNFVWKIDQASRLIESFLMGLPVPQVFFYVNDEDNLEVIDGQQRILSVKYFLEGYFGEEDDQGKRKVFKLTGLSDTSSYNDKTFLELDPKDQRKIKNSTLRAINIRQISPIENNDCVFYIFQRLNTGGTQLKPQEIRNAVYRGNIVSVLQNLNLNPDWLKILGFKKPHKNQKDIEIILRLFGLFNNWSSYERPMIKFLNLTMKNNRSFDSPKAKLFVDRFPKVCRVIVNNIINPFRPKGVINTAILEAVFVALLEQDNIDDSYLLTKYENLLKIEEFMNNTVGPTADNAVLKARIEAAKKILA